jgi:glycosyltransferase involved in cell wall biosynthesis
LKILIVSQYFWPENFKINDLAVELVKRGHDVTVLTGKPNYPYGTFYKGYSMFSKSRDYWNGIQIVRAPLISRGNGKGLKLLLNYLSFAFFASLKALFISKEIEKIFVYEPSPITVGFPAVVAKKRTGAPIYFWVQDLWPETLTAAGGIKNKYILSLFDTITRYIYRHSRKLLLQSQGFKSYILYQKVPEDKLIYYPNSTENFYKVVEKKQDYLSRLPDGFKIMFAGNIGQGQSFDTLLSAASILKSENLDIKWIILGDGRMKNWVNKRVIDLQLEDRFMVLGAFPSEEMPFFFACADAMIVSLKKNPVFAMTIPAKVQSYLACGRPIIGSLDGEGARIIRESEAGFVAPSENPAELAECVKRLFHLGDEERKNMGFNARLYYEREFEREMLLDRLEKILAD